jgi:predicted N-acyltransferase
VGCVAGEGVLDGDVTWQMQCIPVLKDALVDEAYKLGASLIVFKEFRASHRAVLDRLQADGFARVPSMPMTRLNFDFASFDEYLSTKLGSATRKNLRRKFKAIDAADPIELTVSTNIEAEVDELYPLYLQIYEKSSMRFEKLTPEFLVQLGRADGNGHRLAIVRSQNGSGGPKPATRRFDGCSRINEAGRDACALPERARSRDHPPLSPFR